MVPNMTFAMFAPWLLWSKHMFASNLVPRVSHLNAWGERGETRVTPRSPQALR